MLRTRLAAQMAAPGSRIFYVDNDEVAVAHSRLMLEDHPDATVIQADLREPDKILADPEDPERFWALVGMGRLDA